MSGGASRMQTGNIYHGFRLMEETRIEEINSLARLFEHEITKARLIHLQNDDENRMFLIGFRTPPKDDMGISHIMEHSVLAGSRKFPCKEPFVELLKGSLHTFVNALTGADVTLYPVTTKNEKDYFNLMDVYLDAVFHPAIYERKETFLQEAWHYHIENINDEITYKGVVYNEMKGAYSSPEAILGRLSSKSLFPDTTYGCDSGGNPEVIPELSYQQFLDFHKEYYHPSNSYMILYGQGSLQDRLKFIHEQYLKQFSYRKIDSSVHSQTPFKKVKNVTGYYPVATDETIEDKTYYCYSMVTDFKKTPLTDMALSILINVLVNSEAAPLRRAILDAGFGKDIYGLKSTNKQTEWNIVVKNSNKNQEREITRTIRETLNNLVKNGIDVKLLESMINKMEFSLREANYGSHSKGLAYSDAIMQYWLYDRDPFAPLRFNPLLSELKEKYKKGYFEKLITEHFLNNKHAAIITLLPRQGMKTADDEKLRNKLIEYKKSLSETSLKKLVDQTQDLIKKQMQPDSKESLESIPVLSLDDLDKKAEIIPQKVIKRDGTTTLYHPIATNGISYLSLHFDVKHIAVEDIPYLKLLSLILGRISTKNYSYAELDNEIGIHLGSLSFSLSCLASGNDANDIFPKISVNSKGLYAKTAKTRELIEEIICSTELEDKQRITEIIQEIKSRIEMGIRYDGLGGKRLQSYISRKGRYIETTSGISYYSFIADLERNIDKKFPALVKKLEDLQRKIFNRENLIVSLTAEREQFNSIQNELINLTSTLSNEKYPPHSLNLPVPEFTREGFYIPGQVQFVRKGGNFRSHGIKYSGSMKVLRAIVKLDYLWRNIRVKGGAYGCSFVLNRSGTLSFSSFRDPNLSKSLDVFDESAEFVRHFKADDREMQKVIIGTISRMCPALTAQMKGDLMTARFIAGITQQDIQKTRDEVLSTKVSDINNLAEMLEKVMNEDKICVVGSEIAVKAEKDIFEQVDSILK